MKLNELDLNKFHVFRILAESASMREAGERLLRTPSAVSQSISSLEKSLGVQLFIRSGIRLKLTEAGRRILNRVKGSEQSLQAVLDEVRAGPGLMRGRVTLGLPPGYPAVSISETLSAVLVQHPQVQLQLRFRPHAKLAEALKKGALEMALSLQPLHRWNRRIRSQKLREENLILVVPPRFRYLADGVPNELPVVDYYQNPLLIDGWLKHHRRRRVQTRIRVFASNLDYVLQLVRNGVGCAVVPRHVVQPELSAGSLLEHAWDRRRPWIAGVWLNTFQPADRFRPAALQVFNALIGT